MRKVATAHNREHAITDGWSFELKIFVSTFAWLLPVAAIAQANPNHEPDRTWITDVNIISPEKLDHIEKRLCADRRRKNCVRGTEK